MYDGQVVFSQLITFVPRHPFTIKQHLRIKAFFGTSPNAVKTQIWIAICVYVLVSILAKEQAVTRNPSDILQIPRIMLSRKCLRMKYYGRTPSHSRR